MLNRSIFFLLILFALNCKSYVDIPPPKKGSPENPVLCDMPDGQRRYLKLLRSPEGEPVKYEYLDSVLGTKGKPVDRFKIENPDRKKDKRNVFSQLLDYLVSEPEVPPHFRIYMDFYNPGVLDSETPPGFKLANSMEGEKVPNIDPIKEPAKVEQTKPKPARKKDT